ncbi:hypothetical protein [Shewanella septentrionalis]|uniref:Uncharacterized protein n=1 Tax=Shewanella septentrionalis TaxID=2952223 RepID=A0A9X2WSV8_9GAMM|nr:hypothetical protein [Shewanella septentrionalis]MCT7944850.1 hypothetical protein [Shewanella septentrionalis]
MDRGLISFFEIVNCGFYSFKNKELCLVEGSVQDSLCSVTSWLQDRDFTQTIPWDVDSSPNRTKVYCKAVEYNEVNGDYIFVFWNRFGDESGKVAGISADAKFGGDGDSVNLSTKEKGKEVILGQPMYYWFIPEYNLVASINFPHSTAATEDVCMYVKRCIDLRIEHPRKKVNEATSFNTKTSKQITTKYVSYKSEGSDCSLRYKFECRTKELSFDNYNLKKLSSTISHIVIRDTISTVKEDDKDTSFKLYDLVRGVRNKKTFTKQVEIIEKSNFSAEELKSISSLHKSEYSFSGSWNNIGFREDNSEVTHWLNDYARKEQIFVDPLKSGVSYHSAKKLMEEIQKIRSDILVFVAKSNSNLVSGFNESEMAVGE